ncbi:MAG TPA: PDZ domain-containing protein, partial [Bacteroidales bacterium]|nr:PDZ domain-containing protein [Bacteroidales bacterium]
GMNVHGIIGHEFFNHFVVKVDYDRKLITVYDPEVYRPRRRDTAIPFSIEQGRPYIAVTVIQDDDTKINAKLLIDSGASHGLMLETDTKEEISLPDKNLSTIIGWGLGGELAGHLGRIKALKIKSFMFKDVLVSFAEDYSDPEATRVTGRNGSIGGDVLSRFTTTFDYPGNTLYLRKNRAYRYPFEYNLSGIDLVASGRGYDSFRIIHVIGNSPAWHAGIRNGDIILVINGKLSSDVSLSEINTLLRSRPGTKINLTINRDAEIMRVSFRLRRLI